MLLLTNINIFLNIENKGSFKFTLIKMLPVNVVDLDSNLLKEFLDSFDHVFSDCDGMYKERY